MFVKDSAAMQISDKNAIIRMFHVHKRYGSKQALVNVTLDIAQHEFVFVSGPSGAGKSTLLKLLYVGEPVSEGQILMDGMNLARIPRRKIPHLRRSLGIIFQDYKLIPSLTVFENVALVLEVMGKKQRLIQKKVNSVLRTVGMQDRHRAMPLSLSGGEQQRVAVARAIVGDPKIILADEPTGSLDAEAARVIFDLLLDYHQRGATMVVATHDQSLIEGTTSRVVKLVQGNLQEPSAVQAQP